MHNNNRDITFGHRPGSKYCFTTCCPYMHIKLNYCHIIIKLRISTKCRQSYTHKKTITIITITVIITIYGLNNNNMYNSSTTDLLYYRLINESSLFLHTILNGIKITPKIFWYSNQLAVNTKDRPCNFWRNSDMPTNAGMALILYSSEHRNIFYKRSSQNQPYVFPNPILDCDIVPWQ